MIPFVKRKVSDVGQSDQKPKPLEKPAYATAPRSRWIPSNDPKPRVNVEYKKPPNQLIERRKRKKD